MKVVINNRCGLFALSEAAYAHMGKQWDGYGYDAPDRDDPKLVAAVETLGERANGFCASLKIVEIPDGVDYYIDKRFDGRETIHEYHRVWS